MKITAIMNDDTLGTYNKHAQDRTPFAQTIDFKPLFDHIRELTNCHCDFSAPMILPDRMGDLTIAFESEELSNQTGPFAAILKDCRIKTFNSWVYKDRETGTFGCSCTVNISYEHKDGGSNGMELTRASYADAEGWRFRDAGGR